MGSTQALYDIGMMFLGVVLSAGLGAVLAGVTGIAVARWLEFEATKRQFIVRVTEMAAPVVCQNKEDVIPALNEKFNRLMEVMRAEGVVQFELQGHTAATEAAENTRSLIFDSYGKGWRPEVRAHVEAGAWYCMTLKEEVHAEAMTKAEAMYPNPRALFRLRRMTQRSHTGRIERVL